jgi:outer membrane receptor protein involved in Fe transport
MKTQRIVRRAAWATGLMMTTALGSGVAVGQTVPANEVTIQEVVVTAEKRSENIQKVPETVEAVSDKQLSQYNLKTLEDISGYIPGLTVSSNGAPGYTILSIRGITPLSTNATTAVYIDDTPLGSSALHNRPASFSADLLPYDVQRIEVLEGPQGTLYGANAFGGVVKYILTQPNLDKAEFRVGGDVEDVSGGGSVGGDARGMINAPLIKDKLGVIASYSFAGTPGYVDDIRTGQKDQNNSTQNVGRLALLWQASPKLNVKLDAMYQGTDANLTEVALSPTTIKPIYGNLTNDNYVPDKFKRSLQYYTAEFNWDLDWAKLLSASSYTNQDDTTDTDDTIVYGPYYSAVKHISTDNVFDLHLTNKKFTQEFRLSSPSGQQLEWLVGAFYDNETGSNHQTISVLNSTTLATVAPFNPAVIASLPTTYQEYAFFGTGTYHLSENIGVTAGVRYADNTQTFAQNSGGTLANVVLGSGKSSESAVTYSISPYYNITKDIMAYAKVASGYQPGGPNIQFSPSVPSFVGSSTMMDYEGGIKSNFWNHRATLNLSLFDLEWNRIQVNASTGGFTYTANGGTARSRGVEVEGVVKPVSGLQLAGEMTYDDAQLTQAIPSIHAVAGNKMPNTPMWTGSVRADYTRPLKNEWNLDLGAGVRLQGTRFDQGAKSSEQYTISGYGLLDTSIAISDGRYTFKLYAKNVTDKRAYMDVGYFTNGVTGVVNELKGIPVQPRTVGISLDTKF